MYDSSNIYWIEMQKQFINQCASGSRKERHSTNEWYKFWIRHSSRLIRFKWFALFGILLVMFESWISKNNGLFTMLYAMMILLFLQLCYIVEMKIEFLATQIFGNLMNSTNRKSTCIFQIELTRWGQKKEEKKTIRSMLKDYKFKFQSRNLVWIVQQKQNLMMILMNELY